MWAPEESMWALGTPTLFEHAIPVAGASLGCHSSFGSAGEAFRGIQNLAAGICSHGVFTHSPLTSLKVKVRRWLSWMKRAPRLGWLRWTQQQCSFLSFSSLILSNNQALQGCNNTLNNWSSFNRHYENFNFRNCQLLRHVFFFFYCTNPLHKHWKAGKLQERKTS